MALASKVTVERTSTGGYRKVTEPLLATARTLAPFSGSPSWSHTSVMPNVDRPVTSTTCAPAAYARRTAATTSGLTVSSTRPVDGSLANSVPSMSSATSRGKKPLTSANDRLQDLTPAQVRLQRRRDAHRAV